MALIFDLLTMHSGILLGLSRSIHQFCSVKPDDLDLVMVIQLMRVIRQVYTKFELSKTFCSSIITSDGTH